MESLNALYFFNGKKLISTLFSLLEPNLTGLFVKDKAWKTVDNLKVSWFDLVHQKHLTIVVSIQGSVSDSWFVEFWRLSFHNLEGFLCLFADDVEVSAFGEILCLHQKYVSLSNYR